MHTRSQRSHITTPIAITVFERAQSQLALGLYLSVSEFVCFNDRPGTFGVFTLIKLLGETRAPYTRLDHIARRIRDLDGATPPSRCVSSREMHTNRITICAIAESRRRRLCGIGMKECAFVGMIARFDLHTCNPTPFNTPQLSHFFPYIESNCPFTVSFSLSRCFAFFPCNKKGSICFPLTIELS